MDRRRPEQELEELGDLLQTRSIRKGRFRLASGRTSRYYCDTKATLLSPRGSELLADLLTPALIGLEAEAVGGLAMGALYVSGPVVLESQRRGAPLYGFCVRPRRKDHGLEEGIEQSYHPDGEPLLKPGRRVAVVDDVMTTAGSILKAVDAVREQGCDVVAVVTLLDRREGGKERLRREAGLESFSLFWSDADGNVSIDPAFGQLVPSDERLHSTAAVG